MDGERVVKFIHSFDRGNTDFLNALEERAKRDNIPIIRPAAQDLLKLLLAMKRPKAVLEVGAAIGFSAILMAQYSDDDCKIATIEKYEPRLGPLRENIAAAGFSDKVTVMEGDALDILKELAAPFDFIFMDAAKAQYINLLPHVLRLLAPGGVLVSDNVLQDGDIIESRFAIERRDRTIHARMRAYLYELTHREELVTSILPVADGMTVSVKRG